LIQAQFVLGDSGDFADATVGPRVIAFDSDAICGQPLVQIVRSF
jgi:hypothetical protein